MTLHLLPLFLAPNLTPSAPSSSNTKKQQLHSPSFSLFDTLSLGSLSMAIVAEPKFHVLAVDDSVTDRKLIERLLKTSSFQVTTVDSGSKALEFLGLVEDQPNSPSVSSYHQEIEVNLVITDYCMPGMTGYDLLKRIKESSSLKDIPVVIMSSENAPSRINRCLEEGAEEFFLKPVKLSDMKKLRPHILKGKCKDPQQTDQNQNQNQQQHQQQQQNTCTIDITTTTITTSTNKRKAMDDEGLLAPERTRTRYNHDTLTVVYSSI